MNKYFKQFPVIKSLLQSYHKICNYYVSGQPESQIVLHNYGKIVYQDLWLSRFIENKGLLKNKPKIKISIFSVFGSRLMMRLDRSDVKIFFARENVHRSAWKEYDDLCIPAHYIDLSIGFDNIIESGYLRFPLWIMWLFPPSINKEDIIQFYNKVNSPNNSSFYDRKFCSLIWSHYDVGRDELFKDISTIGHIDSDGRYMHNNDDLRDKYNDDKLRYLTKYRFNLCPENSDVEGYCTEKIFEAIYSGCIPIYNGSCNNPEPEILNHNAICFVEMGKNEAGKLDEIRELNENVSRYKDYASQPRLCPMFTDVVLEYLNNLETSLKNIIDNL